ncbi:MAG TPA: Uma2 family endonuclease [Chloroflexia bacterium]|jgi:Uma2 family endonuclease|nr:Uma2 family endonuclease [Chloroflexia bacterium]
MAMTTQAKTTTVDDLLNLPDDGFRYELVEGELHKMPPLGRRHGRIIVNLSTPLDHYVRAQGLGEVYAEVGYLLAENPDTVLAPDVSFLRQERLAEADPDRPYWVGAPDLAVEVVSPGDRYSEVNEKVARWLAAGTLLVWVIDPRRQQIAVHQAPSTVTNLALADTLDGGDVLPGWTLPVREVFA